MINAIAAIGRNRVLGKNNELLWKIPDDLKRFKALTMGHPLVMGRKTFESIGKPLPGRTNIVVTRDASWAPQGPSLLPVRTVLTAGSIEEAIKKAKAIDQEIFIIGGAQIYEQALPFVDRLYLTVIEDEKEGDAYFPAYEKIFTKKIKEEKKEWDGLKYSWVELQK